MEIVDFKCLYLPSPGNLWAPCLCCVLTRGTIGDFAAYWGIHVGGPERVPDEQSIAKWVSRNGNKIPENLARAMFRAIGDNDKYRG